MELNKQQLDDLTKVMDSVPEFEPTRSIYDFGNEKVLNVLTPPRSRTPGASSP